MMRMTYDLWDAVSRNLTATYNFEDDGAKSFDEIALVRHEPDGSSSAIAH